MKISILTLFPEMFQGPFDHSIVKRAKDKGLVSVELVNIRNFGIGRHKIVDDKPFGGGVGMILRVDVIDKAIQNVKCLPAAATALQADQMSNVKCRERVILLDTRGETFNQQKAKELSKLDHLILIAGHYEGVDERVNEHLADEAISIGDYILTGGEIPTMVIMDSVVRLIPGVLTKPEATKFESFSKEGYLEHPQYTRPNVYRGWKVPKVLLSGHHRKIDEFRRRD